ncbi:MAG: hypothetical protein HYR63_07420 [Proteobacteria bacterium]|nr:hypothetical protein [Pseudomonadota bacterium]
MPSVTAALSVRADLTAAHARAWRRLARPGTWWTGSERIAIAAETRHADDCLLCRKRKAALSPDALLGAHDHLGQLPLAAVDAIHRIRTDPARLSRSWMQRLSASGLTMERYVELIDIVAETVAIDTFAKGVGTRQRELPIPVAGAPTQRQPEGARAGGAWIDWVEPEDASAEEAGMYPSDRAPANIHKAMSLVPDAVRGFFDLVEHQYLPGPAMRDFGREYRAITHTQIELLAGRVSALNRCLY